MKNTGVFLIIALFLTFFAFEISAQLSDRWHYPLYLSNMDYWHSRIPVEVSNSSANDVSGGTVKMKIGRGEGLLPLDGVNVSGLRVVESGGTEFLWRVISPGKKILTEGLIQAGSEFILPVTVKSGKSETYYIYYDNPAAWPIGAVLEEERYGRKDGKESQLPGKNELIAEIKVVQEFTLSQKGIDEAWPSEAKWDIRVPLKVFNFGKSNTSLMPVYVKMEQVYLRLHEKSIQYAPMQMGSKTNLPCLRFEKAILFEGNVSPATEQTSYAYFAGGTNYDKRDNQKDFSVWRADKRNLLLRMPESGKINKIWSKDIIIEPGKTYMFGAMVKFTEKSDGMTLNIRFKGTRETLDNSPEVNERFTFSNEWQYISGVFRSPKDATSAIISLKVSGSDTAKYNGLLLMEVMEGYSSSLFFDQRDASDAYELALWQVNPVVKVFQEDLPGAEKPVLRISSAKNETEPLQIALRSPEDFNNMKIEVTDPVNSAGQKLDQVSVNIVGYVPVDYPSNYYERKVPYWHLKYPTEPIGSDGWTGFWPDPLLPAKTFDLKANKTQPVWIEVSVPGDAENGDYEGKLKLFRNDTLVKELAWTVHVWNFTLPVRNSFGALYDYRSVHRMPETGPSLGNREIDDNYLRNMYLSEMAKHRISSGEINPVPKVDYADGKVSIDFTEYDKAAAFYFDDLKNPFAYLPVRQFYLFGWAFPPAEKFNEKPYPGAYPYADADRSKLRPEYKKAYQMVLKTFWDHLKEKGWADRYILYLSDEPHEADEGKGRTDDIKVQMKALCDMIHEVDPEIPIYVSTWWYRPEWEGYIDVWGLGFNGEGDYGHYVTKEDMKHITDSGDRIWFTTDGNFCTETPFMALERLLPWFGYKYGAEAYEFWGVNWLTYNPFKYGWHSYIFESQAPGQESWKRYPNGDGYIIYPGNPIGNVGLVGSIRLKQVREGAEDYEYFSLLGKLIESSDPDSPEVKAAGKTLLKALELINIPCAMGRYSTKILKSPDEVLRVREEVAESIEKLGRK